MIYNVLFKGFSIGMTYNREEAMSWCNGPGYVIKSVRIK